MKRIDSLLQPGEKIVFRSGYDSREGLKILFVVAIIGCIAAVGYYLGYDPAGFWALPTGFLVVAIFLSPNAIVTDRRLLLRPGLLGGIAEQDLSLREVESVEGLERGSARRLRILARDGQSIELFGLVQPREVGKAVARGSGLPVSTSYAPAEERASKVLFWSALFAALAGFALATWLLTVTVGFFAAHKGLKTVLLTALFWPAGIALGRAAGLFLGLLYLRPVLTPEPIRESILYDFQRDEWRRLTLLRRALLAWAGLLWGQRIPAEAPSDPTAQPTPPAG